MKQAHARKASVDEYLQAPKRAHLHVVEEERRLPLEELPEPKLRPVPDWAEADWEPDGGKPEIDPRTGRRTVTVTGRPGHAHYGREYQPRPSRARRPSPTRARLAARPDRVAAWAVGLGLLMAAMAAVTAGDHTPRPTDIPEAPPALTR